VHSVPKYQAAHTFFLHTFGSYVQQGDYMIIGTILAITDTISSYLLIFEEKTEEATTYTSKLCLLKAL
jgi:hypothetical protein